MACSTTPVDAQLRLWAEAREEGFAGRVGVIVLHDEELAARQELLQVIHVGHDSPVQHAPGSGLQR